MTNDVPFLLIQYLIPYRVQAKDKFSTLIEAIVHSHNCESYARFSVDNIHYTFHACDDFIELGYSLLFKNKF